MHALGLLPHLQQAVMCADYFGQLVLHRCLSISPLADGACRLIAVNIKLHSPHILPGLWLKRTLAPRTTTIWLLIDTALTAHKVTLYS